MGIEVPRQEQTCEHIFEKRTNTVSVHASVNIG